MDPAAIEKVYLGWYYLRNDNKEGWQRALDMFGDVARTHPDHPYGHVLSGFAWWLGAANGWVANTERALTTAVELAQQGAATGDPTGMAQAVEGEIVQIRTPAGQELRVLPPFRCVANP